MTEKPLSKQGALNSAATHMEAAAALLLLFADGDLGVEIVRVDLEADAKRLRGYADKAEA